MKKNSKIPKHIKTDKGKLNYLLSAIQNQKYKLERIEEEAKDTKAEIAGISKQITVLTEKLRVVT